MKPILISSAFLCLLPGFTLLGASNHDDTSFIGPMHTIKAHASTVPKNGDVNPYGVAVVPNSVGALHAGSVLVSNFNNSNNLQGTGTTIVQVSPGDGSTKLFAQIDPTQKPASDCPGGIGLTTALVVLRSGWVIVGSLPTSDGSSGTAMAGCLLVLNSSGKVVEIFSGGDIDGPWDMTAADMGSTAVLFVTNVLNGNVTTLGSTTAGTVVRIVLSIPGGGAPTISSSTVIASGFGEQTSTTALIVGPTGVGLGSDGTLYVADTLGNRITAIANAFTIGGGGGTGTTVIGGGALNGPLGLAIVPNGDILVVNANDGNMVEITPGGTQAAMKPVDVTQTPGGGTLFGLAIRPNDQGVYFVNDGNNTLDLLH